MVRGEHLAGVLATLREPEQRSARILIGVQSCRCCGRGGVDPRLVAAVLDGAERIGRDLTLTSGYRCEKHNAACGGNPRSKHMAGAALDVAIPDGMEPLEFFRAMMEVRALDMGGCGIDPQRRFVHFDLGRCRRWAYKDGKEVSWGEVFPSTSRE